ncbi:MAG: hypothetical protein PHT19_17450 [Methylococcus sp.]|nr:hypothetical protein [Methylococcus sp.]
MSQNKYHGRFALERYRGYWLWAVQRRAVLNRPYPKTLLCGRTDTEAEAYGRIAQSLAGIGCEAITGGWLPSWAQVREQLRAEGIALSGGEAEKQFDQAAQEARYAACWLLAAYVQKGSGAGRLEQGRTGAFGAGHCRRGGGLIA